MCFIERVERVLVLNKTDLEWCTGTENDKKLRKNMGGSRGGGEWMASHPPLEQLTKKKIYQRIMRGKTYENTWVPKKSRKLPVTISFIEVIFSGKEGTL